MKVTFKLFLICFVGLLFISIFNSNQSYGGNMIKGKKVAMIIASDQFRDEEYQKPREIFEKEGGIVTVFSSSLNESTGMFGAKAKPDKLITDLKVALNTISKSNLLANSLAYGNTISANSEPSKGMSIFLYINQ